MYENACPGDEENIRSTGAGRRSTVCLIDSVRGGGECRFIKRRESIMCIISNNVKRVSGTERPVNYTASDPAGCGFFDLSIRRTRIRSQRVGFYHYTINERLRYNTAGPSYFVLILRSSDLSHSGDSVRFFFFCSF